MNKKTKIIFGILGLVIILAMIGYTLFKKNIGVINVPSTATSPEQTSGVEVPYLKVPEGFKATVFAKDVPGARVIAFDEVGDMLVSLPSEGKIVAIPDRDNNGVADKVVTVLSGLKKPHGIATRRLNHDSGGLQCAKGECELYVAEVHQVSVYDYESTDSAGWSLTNKRKLIDISSSLTDRHTSRSLLFLPTPDEDTLLISVGSSCDACEEKSPDYASVISYNIKTKEKAVYARGLRNAPFMTLDPVSGKVFATEMGRDGLGDNIPPDEINIIEKGKNYGWPFCYGKNVHDNKFDKSEYLRNPCTESSTVPSFVDLQAHSAPLGLNFIPEEGWPEDHWYNLVVAYHGSWNRSVATGYKLVRIKMDAKGNYLGTEDFITGWLTADGKKHGRPADVKIMPGGTMYISDDLTGVIYKISRISE